MGYKMPSTPSQLSGTTRARVTSFKEVSSKYGPQIEFGFTTDRGNTFKAWMTITSLSQVQRFLEAGILRTISDDEYEVTPIGIQPHLTVTLEKGKIQKMVPVQ